jgi:hypothetical protein
MPEAKLETAIPSRLRSRKFYLLTAIGIFVVSRCIYYWMGVRFDATPLWFYWQMIDPALLRDALWQSLLYLRTQPPGLNLFIGVTMHLFPQHTVAAFHATYLGLGLILTICLFLLLDGLRVSRPVALVITVVCVVSPVTVLYENWLFYEYPIAVLFAVSALFLHRYTSSGRRVDGLVLFSSLALLGWFRVFYHILWFCLTAVLIVYALPERRRHPGEVRLPIRRRHPGEVRLPIRRRHPGEVRLPIRRRHPGEVRLPIRRRRTVLCAAGPGVLLLLIYVKTLVLFGVWVPGSDVQGGINLAAITSGGLPPDVLTGMVSSGAISPLVQSTDRLEATYFVAVVPMPPKTGIPILDTRLKSTGWINMDSLWMAAAAKQLRQDGLVLLRAHPRTALSNIGQNIRRSFLPADLVWPLDQARLPNRLALSPWLDVFDLLLYGKPPAHRYAFFSYFTIPFLLWFGLRRSARWLTRMIRHPSSNADDMTISFAFGNVAYLTVVAILLSAGDQNRYAFEVFPLYTILLASAVLGVTTKIRTGLFRGREDAIIDVAQMQRSGNGGQC